MAWLSKRKLYNSGLTLLTLFFICEGLSTMYLYEEEALNLDAKIHNVEATLNNNFSHHLRFKHLLPFQRVAEGSVGTPLARLIMFTYGLATLVSGSLLYWFDEKRLKTLFA